ncbi:hypothetical protein [Catenovulum maritimum]|uniref:Lipoprotein n=1 Tax=Catenovulum maritimum TaxID=1513271 RepID=A0A0J8H0V8_9ALTE|nr:hypothetical protein [Catenovulum maritimum]KMT66648.1 hypothetical protein XM47_00485 [Catenovulum maritimum]
MKLFKLLCFFIGLFIVGCAYQPAPYQVVDSLPYKRGYMNNFYKVGVTEEIIKAKHYYKITVKLDNGSSKTRAENMLLFHSAQLAQANGSKGFTIKKINNTVWCGISTLKEKAPYVKDSAPISTAFITLIQPTTPAKMLSRPSYQAAKIIAQHQQNVLQGESKSDAEINRKTNEETCWARLKNT